VTEVQVPVNVLALPGTPAVPQLRELGVRRVSTGGALAFVAYGALVDAADELRAAGTSTFAQRALHHDRRRAAFDDRSS
jgi:2-methylisocitrate lyase-like PEP mutase family enzyme